MSTNLYTFQPGEYDVRWKAPYTSDNINRRLSGVNPRGIYKGFGISTSVTALSVTITCDPERSDHLALYRVFSGDYDLTVRRTGGSFNLSLASFTSTTVVLAISVSFQTLADTTAYLQSYTLAEFNALSSGARSELIVLGSVVVPASGLISSTAISYDLRVNASSSSDLTKLPWFPLLSNADFSRCGENMAVGWTPSITGQGEAQFTQLALPSNAPSGSAFRATTASVSDVGTASVEQTLSLLVTPGQRLRYEVQHWAGQSTTPPYTLEITATFGTSTVSASVDISTESTSWTKTSGQLVVPAGESALLTLTATIVTTPLATTSTYIWIGEIQLYAESLSNAGFSEIIRPGSSVETSALSVTSNPPWDGAWTFKATPSVITLGTNYTGSTDVRLNLKGGITLDRPGGDLDWLTLPAIATTFDSSGTAGVPRVKLVEFADTSNAGDVRQFATDKGWAFTTNADYDGTQYVADNTSNPASALSTSEGALVFKRNPTPSTPWNDTVWQEQLRADANGLYVYPGMVIGTRLTGETAPHWPLMFTDGVTRNSGAALIVPFSNGTSGLGAASIRIGELSPPASPSIIQKLNASPGVTVGDGITSFGDFCGGDAINQAIDYMLGLSATTIDITVKAGAYTLDTVTIPNTVTSFRLTAMHRDTPVTLNPGTTITFNSIKTYLSGVNLDSALPASTPITGTTALTAERCIFLVPLSIEYTNQSRITECELYGVVIPVLSTGTTTSVVFSQCALLTYGIGPCVTLLNSPTGGAIRVINSVVFDDCAFNCASTILNLVGTNATSNYNTGIIEAVTGGGVTTEGLQIKRLTFSRCSTVSGRTIFMLHPKNLNSPASLELVNIGTISLLDSEFMATGLESNARPNPWTIVSQGDIVVRNCKFGFDSPTSSHGTPVSEMSEYFGNAGTNRSRADLTPNFGALALGALGSLTIDGLELSGLAHESNTGDLILSWGKASSIRNVNVHTYSAGASGAFPKARTFLLDCTSTGVTVIDGITQSGSSSYSTWIAGAYACLVSINRCVNSAVNAHLHISNYRIDSYGALNTVGAAYGVGSKGSNIYQRGYCSHISLSNSSSRDTTAGVTVGDRDGVTSLILEDIDIKSNNFRGTTGTLVYVLNNNASGSSMTRVRICGNTLGGSAGGHGVEVGTIYRGDPADITISDNSIQGPTTGWIVTYDTDGTSIDEGLVVIERNRVEAPACFGRILNVAYSVPTTFCSRFRCIGNSLGHGTTLIDGLGAIQVERAAGVDMTTFTPNAANELAACIATANGAASTVSYTLHDRMLNNDAVLQ